MWAIWRDGTVYDTEHLAKHNVRGLRGALQTLEQQSAALAQAAKKTSAKRPRIPATATPRRTTKTPAAKAT